MSASLVRHASSIAMPPRGPVSSPHARASSSRARMPAENTIMSASRCVPSANAIRCAPSSPSTISSVFLPVCTVTPSASIFARSIRPPPSSTCTAISRGANSTTWVSSPMSRSAFAHSRPSSPPPITTPRFACAPHACIASRSSIVRYTKQPARSRPGTGGTNGREPVASTSLSYASVSPDASVTVCAARSIDATCAFSRRSNCG
ncbi:hypothetical protein BSE24067_04969 [Burkholderia seminalis]|nr:hypothetical protein BSE24067_04969 [Burkholderia seminalis]